MFTKDRIIVIVIYLVAFGIIVYYNLSHSVVNDAYWEYDNYLANIKEGWIYRNNLVNSSLVMTWIPAMIQRFTHLDTWTLFRVYPAFFYPLMPVFTYLIARKYLTINLAVIAPLVIILSAFFIYYPDMGRNGIAWGFLAGMIWALLNKKVILSIIFATLVVLSHYSTGVIAIVALICVLAASFVWNRKNIRVILPALLVLIAVTGIWHFGIAKYSGYVMFNSAFQTATPSGGDTLSKIPPNLLSKLGKEILDPTTRDVNTQSAFGFNLSSMSTPAKLEVIFNWIVVIMITLGLFLTLRRKDFDRNFKIIAVSLYGIILFVIAVPWLSLFYGTQRAYFIASIVLATCLPVGIDWVVKKIHIPVYVAASLILIPYALSTSGIIYLPFDLVKTFPVVAP